MTVAKNKNKTKADKAEPKKKGKDPEVKALEKRLKKAEVKKAEVELARAQISLDIDKLRRVEVEESLLWKLNSDRMHGVFNLQGNVGRGVVDLSNEIRQYGRLNPEAPITLNIFSPGGSVFDGLVLYDTLRTLADQGHAITTVTRGYAASMGSLIFLAGDNRLIGEQAMVMFHTLAAGTGGMLYEMEDDLEFYRKLNKRLDHIVLSRTKIKPETLAAKTKKKDWWVSAQEAKKYGVATQII